MPLPTTRRGRYLYYQARYRKRLAMAKNRRRRGTAAGHHLTQRERDLSGLVKQAPKRSPKIVGAFADPNYYADVEYRESTGWGVPPVWALIGDAPLLVVVHRDHFAAVGAVKRRMRRVPRLRRLPMKYP